MDIMKRSDGREGLREIVLLRRVWPAPARRIVMHWHTSTQHYGTEASVLVKSRTEGPRRKNNIQLLRRGTHERELMISKHLHRSTPPYGTGTGVLVKSRTGGPRRKNNSPPRKPLAISEMSDTVTIFTTYRRYLDFWILTQVSEDGYVICETRQRLETWPFSDVGSRKMVGRRDFLLLAKSENV
jgi:hypothetical protein